MTDPRRPGNSRLVYDKAKRTIVTVTQPPNPREDALAKAREALALGRRWTTEHLGNCSEDDTPDEVSKIKEDLADIDDAIASLTALSAPPSQSESDDDPDLHAPFVPCRVDGRSVTEWVFEDVAHIAQPAFPGLYHFIDELVAMDDKRLVGVQFWGPPPSPTPYVRPAAEIRAEIERRKRPSSFYEDAAEESFDRGFRSGAAFALTPPTQEDSR